MQHARIFNSSTSKSPKVDRKKSSSLISDVESRSTSMHTIKPDEGNTILHKNIGTTLTVGSKRFQDLNASRQEFNKTFVPRENALSPQELEVSYSDLRDSPSGVKLTVWFHEIRTSSQDLLLDVNSIPGVKVGEVYELQTLDKSKKLVFVVGEKTLKESNEQPSKTNFQVSLLSNPLQKILDLPPRATVQLKRIRDVKLVEADSVEIYIKDVNLKRDSMWTFSTALVNTNCYVNKRLEFLGSRTGVVRYIYKNGKRVISALIGADTKIVFRSDSAKIFFLIQISREMWNFEENGEIMFNKLVNNLFPKIFRTWRDTEAHHSISVILFTSVDLTDVPWTSLNQGERPKSRRDFFRVVVDQVNIFHWDKIMANLRIEFTNFKRDIMLYREGGYYYNKGETMPSVKGNILEAINMGISVASDRFKDTDLRHTLTHFIVITPGTGLYDVDYDLMAETSKKVRHLDGGLDIICLSQPPLHIVPLFRYQINGVVHYSVPNWCYISFYQQNSGNSSQWIPRCKIYELQMMGVTENDRSEMQIERFRLHHGAKSVLDAMDSYDNKIFKPISYTLDKKKSEERKIDLSSTAPILRSQPSKESMTALSLIKNTPISSQALSTTATIDVSTNISQAEGTVGNTKASALSSLYSLNKQTDISSDKLLYNYKIGKTPPFKGPVSGSSNMMHDNGISASSTISQKSIHKLTKEKSKAKPQVKAQRSEKKDINNRRKSSRRKSSIERERKNISDMLWVDIENPSKDASKYVLPYFKYSRWNDVFPKNVRRKLIKWRSFQSPAILPLMASAFPTSKQLESEYKIQIYTLLLNEENYMELDSPSDLMRELIHLRLLLGFQICFNDQVKRVEANRETGSEGALIKYFPKGNCHGSIIYLSFGGEIHRIMCDYDGTLSIQLYHRIESENDSFKHNHHESYRPLIRTRYVEEYNQSKVDTLKSRPRKYNWNQLDQFVAGFEDSMPDSHETFYRMKFVIVPSAIPKNAFSITNENLTDEEIRVEGLRKLIASIERDKFTKEHKRRVKEEILPEINFYTGNLYDFLNEQAETYDLTGNQPNLMLPDSVRFNKNIKLASLGQEIQDPSNGLKLVDRTWHFKTHPHCFVGSEFVSWLIEGFEDVDDREEATVYGQTLMNKGLFKHVENRHGFLDGHYFYQIEEEYVDRSYKVEKASWFNKKKNTENNYVPHLGVDYGQPNSPSLSQDSGGSENSSLTRAKRKFILSRSVKFDVDPLRKSFRNEVVTVHYDRVHNPEHCYHIRLHWLNTTSKFIDDTVSNWSRLCERHGLKLIETPVNELCTIPQTNQFQSFVELQLALDPWKDVEFMDTPVLKDNIYYFHLYLLKHCDFLLDNRSAVFFSKDHIEISYSWGVPVFKYAQFIHKTGYYIVEIRSNGEFFLAPNNVHIKRQSTSSTDPNAQRVMLEYCSACRNTSLLRELFREAKLISFKDKDTELGSAIFPSYI